MKVITKSGSKIQNMDITLNLSDINI